MDQIQELMEVVKTDPNGLRPGQLIEEIAWEVIDSPTGQLEVSLVEAASQIRKQYSDPTRCWYAGQLQGFASVVHARRARTAALARNPIR